MRKKIITAICGASGTIYGIRLLKALLENETDVLLILSNAGKLVLTHENGYKGEPLLSFLNSFGVAASKNSTLSIFDEDNFFAPPASGSFMNDGMVIAPCTMGTLGAIASGIGNNLIHRSADVCLKEKRPLVLLTRETPLNTIHLENMLKAARAGSTIMPASPSFYSTPETIYDIVDTVVARILNHFGIEHKLVKQWGDSEP